MTKTFEFDPNSESSEKNEQIPVFNPKSEWQKDDCINGKCDRESTLQADLGKASIRCCDSEECKKIASELAISQSKIDEEVESEEEKLDFEK